jgi:hypothetical protein
MLANKHPSGVEKLECYALCCLKKLISISATRQLLELFFTFSKKKNRKAYNYSIVQSTYLNGSSRGL